MAPFLDGKAMSIIFHQLIRESGGTLPVSVGSGPIVGGTNSQGLIINTSGEVESVLDGTVDHHSAGLPFDVDGRLVVSANPIAYFSQSIPFTAGGAVAFGGDTTGDYVNQGVAYKDGGGLVSTDPQGDTPGQVQNLVLTTPFNNEINAAWDAVVSVPAVTSYTVEFRVLGSMAAWTQVNVGLLLTLDITGLDSGVTYEVRVFATNASGDGPYSTIQTDTAEGLPQPITDLSASSGDIEQSILNWTAPTAEPPINDYDIEYKETSSGTWISYNVTSLDTSETIFDLNQNVSYDFRARAVNSIGDGPWSNIAQGTPILIGSPIPQLYNDSDISTGGDPVRWGNQGYIGGSYDMGTVSGTLSNQVHKGRPCWQAEAFSSLSSNTKPVPQEGHPQTCFWSGIPFFLNNDFKIIWSSSFQLSDGAARSTETTAFAGTGLSGSAMDTTNTEWLVVWRFNGASSQIRVIKNGGIDNTSFGNTGTGNLAVEYFSWNAQLRFRAKLCWSTF